MKESAAIWPGNASAAYILYQIFDIPASEMPGYD
jgi:hypothetical protein